MSALALGLTALFGGWKLVADPSGDRMEVSLEWLAGTPFTDYFVPGLILFAILGVGSVVVLYGIVRRLDWSWWAAIRLGVALVVGLVTQILLLQQVNMLHGIYGGLGIFLVALALQPSMRNSLGRDVV